MLSLILVLAGCASIGPTVAVTPAPGKTQAEFAADRGFCMRETDAALQRRAHALMLAPRSPDRIRSHNAGLQADYNARWGGCMAARGNVVPAASGVAGGVPVTTADVTALGTRNQTVSTAPTSAEPAINRFNGPLPSDPGSRSAERALASTIRRLSKDCDGVAVTVTDAPIFASRAARLVVLAQPGGGSCFGEPGQNTCLVGMTGSGWSTLLAAEPGSIGILAASHAGYHDVEVRSLGLCIYRYKWTGQAYAKAGSHDCALDASPTVGDVARKMRGR